MSETAGLMALADPLAEDQVVQYLEDGYLTVRGLVEEQEVTTLRDEILRFARGDHPVADFKELAAGTTDEEAMRRMLIIYSPHAASSFTLEFIKHQRICAAVSQLAAAHRYGWDGSTKFVQSTVYLKPPQVQGHPWHQDDRAIRTWDQSLCAAWIPLDDTDADNGCLWVIPGSHRPGYLYPLRQHNQPESFLFTNEAYGFDESEAVPVEMSAGEVMFLSGTLVHRSLYNRTDTFRRVLVNHYASAWTELPWWDARAGKMHDDLRTVIPVVGRDPYAWKGYESVEPPVFVRWRE